jgi:hypothetical protein
MTMAQVCERCGRVHEGDCPEAAGAAASTVATESPDEGTETCALCGEKHPPSYSCAEWARKVGTVTSAAWGGAGFAQLPERPPLVISEPPERRSLDRRMLIAGQVAVLLLAFVGVIALMKLAFDHTGGTSATSVSLPACSHDRIQANVNRLGTIQAEARSALASRVDEANALGLKSSDGCAPDLFLSYQAYLQYSVLCIELPRSDACGNRDAARTQLAQALATD